MKHSAFIEITCIALIVPGMFLLQQKEISNTKRSDHTNISDTGLLRTLILKSIKIPFEHTDMLILSEESGLIECGNLTKEEEDALPAAFETKLDKDPYLQIFSREIKRPVMLNRIFTDRIFSKEWEKSVESDSMLQNKIQMRIDSFYQNKIKMTIKAEIDKDNGDIVVSERYELNHMVKQVGKKFLP